MAERTRSGYTRRDLLRFGTGVGAAIGLGGLVAGCSDPSEGNNAPVSEEQQDAYRSAKIDWQHAKGATIVFGGSTHQWVTALTPLLPAFQSLTGITVRMDISGESEFGTKLPVQLSASSPTPDVFMVPSYGQGVGSGWLEPLDGYLTDTNRTDPDWYDSADVFTSSMDFVTWKDGMKYGLPITAEAQTTIYRTDLLPTPPTTFEQVLESARTAKGKDGISAGIALRGKPTAGAIAWPAAGYVFTYGGYIIDPAGKAALTSPETVAGVQMYADILKAGGPRGVSTWDWLEINTAMQQGQAAMMQDSSNAIPDLRDPAKSRVADKIAAANFPSRDGRSNPNLWHWIVGVNKASQNKDAAWMFLLWATSRPTGLGLAQAGATPPRASAWSDPKFQSQFGDQAAKVVLDGLKALDSKPMTASWMHPKWPEVGDAFARAVNIAATSDTTAASALADAQKKAEAALA